MTARRLVAALLTGTLTLIGVLAGQGTASAKDIQGGAITPGTPVTTTIRSSVDTVTYTFSATAGRHLTFDATASAWDNNTPGQGNVAFLLIDPAGVTRKTCAFERPEYFCEITPATTGTWRAKLDPGVAATGSVTFGLWLDQLPVALSDGQTFTTAIDHQGTQARYTFPATAGRGLTFDTSAATATWPGGLYLSFFRPDGTQLGSRCLGSGNLFCRIAPDVTGTWTVAYLPGSGQDTGRLTTRFQPDVAGPVLTRGTAVTAALPAQGQEAWYGWRPTAGTEATFTVSAASWSADFAYLQTYDATGALRSSCVVQSRPTTCRVTPTTGGDWKVRVDPYGVVTGSMTFSVS